MQISRCFTYLPKFPFFHPQKVGIKLEKANASNRDYLDSLCLFYPPEAKKKIKKFFFSSSVLMKYSTRVTYLMASEEEKAFSCLSVVGQRRHLFIVIRPWGKTKSTFNEKCFLFVSNSWEKNLFLLRLWEPFASYLLSRLLGPRDAFFMAFDTEKKIFLFLHILPISVISDIETDGRRNAAPFT